jgi:hypothetical protein
MTPQEVFVTRLRRYRERTGIALAHIAQETRVKLELLEAFERNDLSGWPRGLYARAWVRSYASIIGIDPADTVEEFCRLFPHGDRRAGDTLLEIATIVSAPPEYRDEFEHLSDVDRRSREDDHPPARPVEQDDVLSSFRRQVQAAWTWATREVRTTRPQKTLR